PRPTFEPTDLPYSPLRSALTAPDHGGILLQVSCWQLHMRQPWLVFNHVQYTPGSCSTIATGAENRRARPASYAERPKLGKCFQLPRGTPLLIPTRISTFPRFLYTAVRSATR